MVGFWQLDWVVLVSDEFAGRFLRIWELPNEALELALSVWYLLEQRRKNVQL